MEKITYHGEIDLLDCIDIARFYQDISDMMKAPNYLTKYEEETGNLLELMKNYCWQPQSIFSQDYQ